MFKGKKIKFIEYLPIIIITLVSYKIINNFESITQTVVQFLPSLRTILWGLAIGYLLNFPMSYLEKKFKLHRILSLIIVYTILLGGFAAFFTNLIPEISSSIKDLISLLPDEAQLEPIISSIQSTFQGVDIFSNVNIMDMLTKALSTLSDALKTSFSSIVSGVNVTVSTIMGITSSLFTFGFGLIISAYVLKDKEKITSYTSNAFKAILKEKHYNALAFNIKEIHEVFSKYIVGKSLDSFIIGVLCFIGLSLMNLRYALLISLVVGVTNMIPYFGPLIGMFPAAFITLLATGQLSKAIGVLVFIILLQQLDGWFIGPKILGDSVGLDPLIVISAIIVGGAVSGILGMFISVPIVAVIRANFERFLTKKANKKTEVDFPPPEVPEEQ